jgi:hypothetical protein
VKATRHHGNCLRSLRPVGPCPRCGAMRVVCHIPLEHKNVACSICCPACTSWKPPVGSAPVVTPTPPPGHSKETTA